MATSRFDLQPGRSHGKEWSYIVTYYCFIYYYFIRPPSVQLMETGTLYLFYFFWLILNIFFVTPIQLAVTQSGCLSAGAIFPDPRLCSTPAYRRDQVRCRVISVHNCMHRAHLFLPLLPQPHVVGCIRRHRQVLPHRVGNFLLPGGWGGGFDPQFTVPTPPN